MKSRRYDVVVIGSGPGGEGAAMKAAKCGKRVAIVERYKEVGGACAHWATIPSKALRYSVQQFVGISNNPLFRSVSRDIEMEFPRLLKHARAVVEQQARLRQSFYDRNETDVLHGHAAFLNANEIALTEPSGRSSRISAGHFVIAVGSRPYRPPDVNFSHPRVLDSDKVLGLDETPRTVTVYGAGVVGCEYASIFRNLKIKTNLVNTRERLLTFLDDEIADALAYHLRDLGMLIRHGEEYESVEAKKDRVVLHLKSGKKISSDYLLWANGRSGNSHDLGLENTKIEVDRRGNIKVDSNYRTAEKNIYAVGDVVGWPSLASAAYDQGRFAATHLVEGKCDSRLVEFMPTGIYTTPEISSIGKNERELTLEKVPYEVGHALFRSLARAQIGHRRAGMLKILFHRETLQILGIHCFGYQAAEIIHIGQAIMTQKGKANSLMYFINTTFNYPTMAEAYRVAALNGINRIS